MQYEAEAAGVVRPMVSVIVPCRNEKRALAPFLGSLDGQDWPADRMEILIADGMSDDGSREVLERYAKQRPGVRVIDNPSRIVPTGLNAAIRLAQGEIVVRLDVHAEYAPDYIRQCVGTLLATGAENTGGAQRAKAEGYRSRLFGAAFNSQFAAGGGKSHDIDYEGYVDTVWLGCWRTGTLLQLGLFDETLVRNQDDELNFRLTERGGKIWQSRNIVCWYTPRTKIRDLWRQYFQYGFWKVAVIRKHKRPASVRHIVPAGFVVFHLGMSGCFALASATGWSGLMAACAAIWGGATAVYAAACFAAAALVSRRNGWDLFPFLPALFVIYHVAYGTGFLAGLFYWPRLAGDSAPAPAIFSELSRR